MFRGCNSTGPFEKEGVLQVPIKQSDWIEAVTRSVEKPAVSGFSQSEAHELRIFQCVLLATRDILQSVPESACEALGDPEDKTRDYRTVVTVNFKANQLGVVVKHKGVWVADEGDETSPQFKLLAQWRRFRGGCAPVHVCTTVMEALKKHAQPFDGRAWEREERSIVVSDPLFQRLDLLLRIVY
jgi:hypothetical protein